MSARPKPTPKQVTEAEARLAAAHRAAVIDEFGELDRQVKAFAPTANRHKALRDEIAAWCEGSSPHQAVSFTGSLYTAHATERQNERYVPDLGEMLDQLGRPKFFKVCEVGIGKLEELLGKAKAATWFKQARTGPRKVSAVANAPAAEGKAIAA